MPEVLNHAVPLTSRDRGKARAMLSRLTDQVDECQHSQSSGGLQTMLMLGVKLEIQGFEQTDGGMKSWLETSMVS